MNSNRLCIFPVELCFVLCQVYRKDLWRYGDFIERKAIGDL